MVVFKPVYKIGFVLFVAGCANNADQMGISIEHSADRTYFASRQASDHCETFQKKSVLVQTSPVLVNALGFRTRVSTFKCVE